MKNKLLIIVSFFALAILLILEGFLLRNTYVLESELYRRNLVSSVFKTYNLPYADSLYWEYRNNLKELIKEYDAGLITKEELSDRFSNHNQKLNPQYLEFFADKLAEQTDSEIQIKICVKELVISNSPNDKDTLILDHDGDFIILGNTFENADGILINTSNWTEFIKADEKYPQFNLVTSILIKMPELYNDVLIKVLWVFGVSFLIFLIIVLLFYYSFSNLLKQKKNSEIKSDFINNITHEFNTPLSTIQISTKMLLNEKIITNPDSIRSTVEVINRQNQRLQNLLDQVIARSLRKDGEITLERKDIALAGYLTKIVEDFKLTIDDNQVIIINNIKQANFYINIDPFYFGIVITNLLNNAVKFEGTFIEIDLKQHKDSYSICISDNGIGIPKTEHKHIFKQFYRVSEKDKNNYKGLGLGLYYCEQIVKLHKGEIAVHSNENGGATFTISLKANK